MNILNLPFLAPRLAALAAENLFLASTPFVSSNILLNSTFIPLLNLTLAC
jgi:hypothetical protein